MALSLRCKRLLRLSIPSRHFLRSCSTTLPEKKGLVLGVYSDDECGGLELTPAAQKYNQISQGKLLEQLKL
ncbi:hypothetical protein Zmor_013372 [Zophobas morio]|uniref:Uncharacterized protein n=2 Tax=Zophobas morio TaxID=2755281 RepID=A0AA38IH79_9CUCU|nr:hypothetical protein Zmor_013372 [Zophobas morio]